MHRTHVEQAFAGERPLAEHILIDLRTGRAVRVNTALPRKQPVKQREVFRRWQWRDDARLQDAVAADHTATARIKRGLILRVGGNADQFAQAAGGKLRVAV